ESRRALGVAAAVACGGVALGGVRVEAGDVLYLALEDYKRRLQGRLRKMLCAQQAEAPARLTMATAWPRAGAGGLEAVGDWLTHHPQARLVVVDTWARFRRSRVVRANEDETDYRDRAEGRAPAGPPGRAPL